MKLVVGLGNPGSRYAGNRHNIGFMAVVSLARRHGISLFRKKFQGQVADGVIAGTRVLLLMPETFMNLSGQSVGEAARFHKIPVEDVIVLHDELDLPPGKVKVKQGGGHGGHNGLRDIDAHLGTSYHRIRLGIGHPGHKDRVHGYVLGDFAKADEAWLGPLLDAVSDQFPLMLAGRPSDFMSKVAAATRPDRPKPPKKTPGTEPSEAPSTPPGAAAAPPSDSPSSSPAPATGLGAALADALHRKNQKGTG
ncbi:MAG: aminoacyl-tRNA hydrolase [Rhodospirillum sp.]|nr:aminoacyl-tRNA hydrolase [Rhodospirillum sp.]MCF8491991.1 aminoacyl-tRNA hydrolase [Rhodospirillum sp.]MCF8503269.1 aminoacyl-tRNA hydrolase [Rhodospirillum sp.]